MSPSHGVSRRLLRPVRMRDREEPHRVSTPLELLFDLCFVVAIASLASKLHHDLNDGHFVGGFARYVALFIPIWWAWMSYTWFATAFDNGDVVFRILTLAQMAGVLVVAASIPGAWKGDLGALPLAYVAMRTPLVAQWLRAALHDRAHRVFAVRYMGGTLLTQALWLTGFLVSGSAGVALCGAAVTVDLLTPFVATRAAPGRVFHAAHIAERYGLFFLIVLGETILAVSSGVRDIIDEGSLDAASTGVCATALLTGFGVWWLYFDSLGRDALERHRKAAFIWGYGHALLYAAIAALGAGAAAQLEDPSKAGVSWFTTLPAAIALVSLAWLQRSANVRKTSALVLMSCAAVLGIVVVAHPSAVVGGATGALVVLVAVTIEISRTDRPSTTAV